MGKGTPKPNKKTHAFLKDSPVKWWDLVLLFVLLLFCFLAFQMGDLMHTSACSFGYLNGHIFDLYDYLAAEGINTGGVRGIHGSYMPTIYLIFALWNIPVCLFGLMKIPSVETGLTAMFWAKLLPCAVHVLSFIPVFLIGKELGMGERKAKLLGYAAVTVPAALYGSFIMGQYESITVFLVLFGVLFWLRRKDVLFIVFFAVAVTVKYTALAVFLPLLFLREKNFWKLLLKLIAVFALFALEFLIYLRSPMFRAYVFGFGSAGDQPTGYLFNVFYEPGFELSGQTFKVYLVVLAFAAVLAWCYFKAVSSPEDEHRYGIYAAALGCTALFCFSKWHPHWLMLALPFYTIGAFRTRYAKIWMILELLFVLLLYCFTVQAFPALLDENLLLSGVFKKILPDGMSEAVKMRDWFGKIDGSLCLSLITALMAVSAFFQHPRFMAEDLSEIPKGLTGWVRARYVVGLLVFILPMMLCLRGSTGTPESAYYEKTFDTLIVLKDDEPVTQEFSAEADRVSKLRFAVSLQGAHAAGKLNVRILDGADEVYTNAVSMAGRYEGEIISLSPGLKLEKGRNYQVSFTLEGAGKDSALCLLGQSAGTNKSAEAGGKDLGCHLAVMMFR